MFAAFLNAFVATLAARAADSLILTAERLQAAVSSEGEVLE